MNGIRASLVLGVCLAATAPAATIFNNGLPNQASADEISDTIVAEDFLLSSAALLSNFQFWDVEDNLNNAYKGSLSWLIYSDAAGTPGSILAQGNASAGQITRTQNIGVSCCVAFNEFSNVVDMSASLTAGSLNFAAGTYWLGLYNGALGDTDFQDFYWETTDNNATTFGQSQDQTVNRASWVTTQQEHAFNISDSAPSTVPEPATWWLSLGPAVMALVARKQGFRRNR